MSPTINCDPSQSIHRASTYHIFAYASGDIMRCELLLVRILTVLVFLIGIGDFDQETSIEPPNSLSSSSSSYDLTYVTRLGGKLRLLCLPPDGIPTPRWYWTRPGGHVVSDKGRLRINSNSELELDDIRLEDAGNYTCHAENLAGKRSLVVNLIVTSEYNCKQGTFI